MVLNQSDYQRRYDELATRFDTAKKQLAELDAKRLDLRARSERLKTLLSSITERDGIMVDFDESVWNATVEKVVVNCDSEMVFVFRNGLEINKIQHT